MFNQRLFLLSIFIFSLPSLSQAMNIFEIKSNQELFFDAAKEGNNDDIQKLLKEKDVNINAQTESSLHTALYLAVAFNRPQTVALLLDEGANPNIADEQNNTPLHIAALKGFTYIETLLLDAHADSSLKNKENQTPLMVAQKRAQEADMYNEKTKKELNEKRTQFKKLKEEGKIGKARKYAIEFIRPLKEEAADSKATLEYFTKALDDFKQALKLKVNIEPKKPVRGTSGTLIKNLATLTKQLHTLSAKFSK